VKQGRGAAGLGDRRRGRRKKKRRREGEGCRACCVERGGVRCWRGKKERKRKKERGARVLCVTEPGEGGRKKGEEKKERRRERSCGERERDPDLCEGEKEKREKNRKEGEEIGWGHVARCELLRGDNEILPTNRVMPRSKGEISFIFKTLNLCEIKWDPILVKPFHLIINI
jgi:hypothetical protein